MVLGFFFNHLQDHGLEDYKGALLILATYPLLQFLFWVFHGTARVIERTNAYYILKNFRTDLFDTLTGLPLKWHKDNHSGGTMSRLEKASAALKGFSDEGFMYHEVIVKFLGSLIALFVISLYTGLVLLGFGFLAALVIFRFDKLLLLYTKQINEKFHLYDATFYDYVLNMQTVITLRLEKLARNETVNRIFSALPIWKKNAKVNEVKWFLLTMVVAFSMFISISLYLYGQVSAGQVLLLGTLVALYEYVQRFLGVFFDLAWKYENLVHYTADIDSIEPIWQASKAFGVRKTLGMIPSDWKNIACISSTKMKLITSTH
ncbi:ABC transporter ATP-binding protein [Candidatus Peregrinibacteria bacterium]|nr:MAG: ABC transporter ATP-binding protein [Candidatus Peregrinibacteria bacterium]